MTLLMRMAAGSKLMKPSTSDESSRRRRTIWKRAVLSFACCCKSRDVEVESSFNDSLTSNSASLPSSITSQLQSYSSHSTVSFSGMRTPDVPIQSFHRKDGDHLPRSLVNIAVEEAGIRPSSAAILTLGKFSSFYTTKSLDPKRQQNNTTQRRRQTKSLQMSAPVVLSSLDILMMLNQPCFSKPIFSHTVKATTHTSTEAVFGTEDRNHVAVGMPQLTTDVTLHYLSPGECPFDVDLIQCCSLSTTTPSIDTLHLSTLKIPQRLHRNTNRMFLSLISVRVKSEFLDCTSTQVQPQELVELRFRSMSLPPRLNSLAPSGHVLTQGNIEVTVEASQMFDQCYHFERTTPTVRSSATLSSILVEKSFHFRRVVSLPLCHSVMKYRQSRVTTFYGRTYHSVPTSFHFVKYSMSSKGKIDSFSTLSVTSSSRELIHKTSLILGKSYSNDSMQLQINDTPTEISGSATPWPDDKCISPSESNLDPGSSNHECSEAHKNELGKWLTSIQPPATEKSHGLADMKSGHLDKSHVIATKGPLYARHGYAANRNFNHQSNNQSHMLGVGDVVQNDRSFAFALDAMMAGLTGEQRQLSETSEAPHANDTYQLFGNDNKQGYVQFGISQPSLCGFTSEICSNNDGPFEESSSAYNNFNPFTEGWGSTSNHQCANWGPSNAFDLDHGHLRSNGFHKSDCAPIQPNIWEVGATAGGFTESSHSPRGTRLEGATFNNLQVPSKHAPNFFDSAKVTEETAAKKVVSPKAFINPNIGGETLDPKLSIKSRNNGGGHNVLKRKRDSGAKVNTLNKLLSQIKGKSMFTLRLPSTCKNIDRHDLIDVLDEFQKPKTLGRGIYSKVKLMKLVSTDQLCAVKIPRKDLEEEEIAEILQIEIDSLESLRGLDCIPNLYGVSRTRGGTPILVQEFIGDPLELKSFTLQKAINDDVVDIVKTMKIALRIVKAILGIYHRGVLHCDLKIDNIMLVDGFLTEEDPKIKIIDFGRAIPLDGTPRFEDFEQSEQQEILDRCAHIAPEIIKGEMPYNICSEIYSLGLIFQDMSFRNGDFLDKLGSDCMRRDHRMRPDLKEIIKSIEKNIKDNKF